jgi:predicted Fe-Mo cluster-binding NifX family protein
VFGTNLIISFEEEKMKIAISASQPNLDADVDPRFGRCQCFVIVELETMEFEGIENPNAGAAGGAGASTAQFIAGQGVQAVITGSIGPNAYRVLSAARIEMLSGASGKVRDAIEAYNSGQLQTGSQPGLGQGVGRGTGQGIGQGMRMGRGMGVGGGMGRGMGRGRGFSRRMGSRPGPMPQTASSQQAMRDDELSNLKNRAEMMAQELAEIQRRIKELEK